MFRRPRPREIVLDLETKRAAAETPGGWSNPAGMGVSMVGVYHYRGKRLVAYRGDRKGDLVLLEAALRDADLVIGFNIARFDLPALSGALGAWVLELPTLDLLQEVQHELGHRLSLDHLAETTLGKRKTGSGLDALEFYRRGQWRKLERYCLQDVRLTRDLYDFARKRGHLLYVPRGQRRRRRFEVTSVTRRARSRPPRRCRRCGTDISDGHHNRQRCEPCARERKLQVDRDLKRRRYREDPDYRERRLAEASGYHAARRADPVRGEELRESQRTRYREDSDYRDVERREASRESHRRAMTDPERREQRNARQRDRYAEDPDYRARKLASSRATYRRGRTEREAGP